MAYSCLFASHRHKPQAVSHMGRARCTPSTYLEAPPQLLDCCEMLQQGPALAVQGLDAFQQRQLLGVGSRSSQLYPPNIRFNCHVKSSLGTHTKLSTGGRDLARVQACQQQKWWDRNISRARLPAYSDDLVLMLCSCRCVALLVISSSDGGYNL